MSIASEEQARQERLEAAKREYLAALEDHLISLYQGNKLKANPSWWREVHPAVIDLIRK